MYTDPTNGVMNRGVLVEWANIETTQAFYSFRARMVKTGLL